MAEKKKSSSVLTSPLRPSRAFAPKLAGGEKREENGHSDSKKNNVNNGESIVQQGSLRIPVSCLDSATNAGLGSEHFIQLCELIHQVHLGYAALIDALELLVDFPLEPFLPEHCHIKVVLSGLRLP